MAAQDMLSRQDGFSSKPKVIQKQIKSIICHRLNVNKKEEYLVEWTNRWTIPPYSWHTIDELENCLALLQTYLNSLNGPKTQYNTSNSSDNCSIPSNATETAVGLRDRSSSISGSSSSASANDNDDIFLQVNIYEYYGKIKRQDGIITMQGLSGHDLVSTLYKKLPTKAMRDRATSIPTINALKAIRFKFLSRLRNITGSTPVSFYNAFGWESPPLSFTFIEKCKLGQGVQKAPKDTVIGCGPKGCRPNMGQRIGCEYGQLCDCLEFAAVNTSRLSPEREAEYKKSGDGAGLAKRFPYFNPTAKNASCLVPFYLESRHPIYECNLRCACGPGCRTRVVQKGRNVPVEIFKTSNRGWGLRCLTDLKRGQFIDTYRGEIITNAEADLREERELSKGKASYLYSLDKHVGDTVGKDDCYVVDGEYMGGPTRFMNHSCDPNVRQYTVSHNKYDVKIYELAFFARRDISASEELTFDYLDKDEEDEGEGENQSERCDIDSALQCLCGSENCRKLLWV